MSAEKLKCGRCPDPAVVTGRTDQGVRSYCRADFERLIEKLGPARQRRRKSGSTRELSPNRDRDGLLGEFLFAVRYGYELDLTLEGHEGDGGVDFQTPAGAVDVKYSNRPMLLIPDVRWRELEKVKADVWVVAHQGELIGWARRAEVKLARFEDAGQEHRFSCPTRFVEALLPLTALDHAMGPVQAPLDTEIDW